MIEFNKNRNIEFSYEETSIKRERIEIVEK